MIGHLPIEKRSHYLLALGLIIIASLALSSLLSRQTPRSVVLQDYMSYRCHTGSNGNEGEELKLLTLTDFHAAELASGACHGKTISRDFDKVRIEWRPRGFLSAQHILEEHYDLFWNRHHLVLGMVPEFFDYYSPLLDTPRYAVHWLSLSDSPAMNSSYFSDKVVGLLADNTSQTYFLQPMNSLKQAGITLAEHQKRLYPDPQALYAAFFNGEVDLITSPLFQVPALNRPELQTLEIDSQVPSGTWFVKKRLVGTGIECDLLAALQSMSPIFPTDSQPAPSIHCP